MGAPNNPKPREMGEWELLIPKTAGNGRMGALYNAKPREMGEWELLITQNRGKWENGSS